MRLNMYRTSKPVEAHGTWYVVDEDAPGAQSYNPVFVGTAAECGRYIDTHDTCRACKGERHIVDPSQGAIDCPYCGE